MVVSRNDSKRRKKEGNNVQGSPKRTKVHAQRKFAQGSQLNSPSLTPVKDKDKAKHNGSAPPADLLPIKRPKTEEFVNFLCFRGSDMLPKSLEFFNEPSIPEPLENPKHDANTASSSRQGRASDKHDQTGGTSKGEAKARGKPKSTAAVQALKKKYQEQRLARGKILNKLTSKASKVKGKPMVRTRSAGPLEESPEKKKSAQSKKPAKSARLVTSIKAKMAAKRKPLLRKNTAPVKRFIPKTNNRGGLRSGGELPPGSDLGIKTERKPRKIIKLKKPIKSQKVKKHVASRLSDFSSDDDQPLAKKHQVLPKKSVLVPRTTRSGLAVKLAGSKARRPTRKTKEAAALFMEMMGKDLRSPEEEENIDEMSVDETNGDSTPKRTVSDRKLKELQEKKEAEDVPQSKPSRKDKVMKSGIHKPTTVAKKTDVNVITNSRKAVIEHAKLKTRILRRNSNRLVKKELELQRNRYRTVSRRPIRAVSKPILKEVEDSSNSDSEEEEEHSRSIVTKEKSLKKDAVYSNKKIDSSKTVKSPLRQSSSKIHQTRKSIEEHTFNDSDEEPLKDKIDNAVSNVKETTSEKKTRSGQIRSEVPISTRTKFVNPTEETETNLKPSKNLEEKLKVGKKVQSLKCESDSEEKSNNTIVQNKAKRKMESNSLPQSSEEKKQTTPINKKPKIKDYQKDSSLVSKKNEIVEHKEPVNLKEPKKKSKDVKSINVKPTDQKDEDLHQQKVVTKKASEVEKDKIVKIDIAKTEISPLRITRKNSKSEENSLAKDDFMSKEALNFPNRITSSANLLITKLKLEENTSTSLIVVKKEGHNSREKECNKEKCSKIDSKLHESKHLSKKDEKFDDAPCKSKMIDKSPSQVLSRKSSKRDVKESKILPETEVDKKFLSTSIKVSKGEKEESKENSTVVTVSNQGSYKNISTPSDENTTLSYPLVSTFEPSKIDEDNSVQVTESSGSKSQEILHNINKKTTLTLPEKICTDLVQSINQRDSVDSKNHDNSLSMNQNLVTNVQPKSLTKKIDNSEHNSLLQSSEKLCVKSSVNMVTEKTIANTNILSFRKVTEPTEKNPTLSEPNDNIALDSVDSSQISMSSLKSGMKIDELSDNTTENKTESITIPFNEFQCSKSVSSLSDITKCDQNLELHEVLTDVHQQVEAFTSDKLLSTLEPAPSLEVLSPHMPPKPEEKINEQTIPVKNPVIEPKMYLMDQTNTNMKSNQIKEVKSDERKSILKPDNSLESRMKIDSSEMSERLFSAIDSLMSLKNIQKTEEKPEFLYPSMSSLKVNKACEVEPKRHLELEQKRFVEADLKRGNDVSEVKRVKFQEPEVKRISVSEHEPKRVTIVEPEVKRSQMPEIDFRRFQVQDNKPKPGPPQVLKGCANPKSMLKPGTLIDIAGISHSPDIMAPLRPGVEGEIIPMNRPVRLDAQDPYRIQMPGAKPYEPKLDQQFYSYRRTTLPLNEKGSLKVDSQERDSAEGKAKVPVNESAWRLAFKNVKDPKSNTNSPAENLVDRKNLSVTALAKRHTIKSKFEGKEKVSTTPQQSVPFLRQSKPFTTLSPNKTKPSSVPTSKAPEIKKSSTNIDLSVLREKEAEITDFVRQMYVEKEMGKSFVPISMPQLPLNVKESEGQNTKPVTDDRAPSQLIFNQLNQPENVSTTNPIQYQQISTQLPTPSNISSSLNVSPFKKKEDPSFKFGGFESDSSTILNQTIIQKQNQTLQNTVQNHLWKVQTPMVPQAVKNIPPKVIEGNGNKFMVLAEKSSTQIICTPKEEFPQTLLQPTVSSTQTSQQFLPSENIFKQIQPTRHLSPTRMQPPSSNVDDNLFREGNMPKRTKSPLSYPQPTARSNSPQSNLGKRNTSSPVSMRPSRNIFKEVVPATRSFSPTSSSTSQTESDAPGNIFSQNSPFKRSISPLCSKPFTAAVVSDNLAVQDTSGVPKPAIKIPSIESGFVLASSTEVGLFIHQQLSTLAATAIMQSNVSPVSKLTVSNQHMKKEPKESQELINKLSNSGSYPEVTNKAQVLQTVKTTEVSSLKTQEIPAEESQLFKSDIGSEAKLDVLLAVEQTLKPTGQIIQSTSKTTFTSAKSNVTDPVKCQEISKESVGKEVSIPPTELGSNKANSKNACSGQNNQSSSIYNRECELDLMSTKKVNMSAEEIKRWLNESSNSVIEHRANCGILENNSCECEHKIIDAQHNIDMMKSESVKPGNTQMKAVNVNKDMPKSNLTRSVAVKEESTKIKEIAPLLIDVPGSLSDSQIESGNSKKLLNESKDSGNSTIKSNVCTPNKSSESLATEQNLSNTPPNKRSSKQDPNLDFSEVSSPPLRDDVSSNISSSNDETPDKFLHPERRSIFHQRRSALKVKERRELIAPNKNAFSPENESSVYAFEPDLPPASTPFRRSKPKDGKITSTVVTDEDENAPSSNSIAVQVNFDNEAVLECSTQTDTQEADDDDTHTFYIPLQQNTADTTKPPMIQGVAVKLDTEGPDQKVIMRAKLVTKPLSTFNQSTSSPGRSLMSARSGGKPEQKVRPLSVKPPVGTVQPTARPKPKPTTSVKEEEPGPSTSKATCSNTSPQAARLAKRLKNKTLCSSESNAPKVAPAKLVEAPTFYPTEKEFENPLEYIDKITPQAEKYGLCRVVPPKNFKPECKVSDDMRFTAYNQYIHKMLHRWGPNVKEMLAIKKYLATYKITLTHPPLISGMEVDLPKLYQTVQQFGGLKEVIEKKRWQKVADSIKIPKSAQDRVTKLDDIYCKFLLPYDTLSHQERTKLFEEVEKDWMEREKKVADSQDTDEESDSESDIDECIVKGRSMALNAFFRIARNTMSMWFPKTETPSAADVELEFWKHVASRQHHVCVHAGSIDTGSASYGFPTAKNSTTSRHPWNLKMLTNNPGSILRFLGPIMGVTVPTLHVGMLFSACCWYRDPHGLAWIEYLHTGASKIWYGIPDSSSAQFRSAVTSLVPKLCQDKQLWLASDTAMVPPPLLVERGVSLSRIVQEPGQFIIVFPKAFTSNICTGYVVSESVYFAPPSWLTTAQNLFYEMRESCEPTVFSLEKLLFSIVNDSRSSTELLNQILPIVVSLRDGEVAGRRQLEELGLNASERLNSNKGRKARFVSDEDEDYECEKCRTNLFISFMSNSHDSSVYCLPHAVELLTHKRSQVKHCTLVYAFSEEELEELVEKLKSRAENKSQKKIQAKSTKS